MGNVDIDTKNFVRINSVFAQLFEEGVYRGRVHIDPESLKELDTVSRETVATGDGSEKGKGGRKHLERLRDAEKVAMLLDGKMAFQVIMGVEGQAGVHYYMPVRCMELDALTYSEQCRRLSADAKESGKLGKYADGIPKGTKIIPVTTVVLYTGSKPWDGPRSLYDMLDIPPDMPEEVMAAMKETMPDYRMNLIDARHMPYEEIDRYEGDLKAFLLMLKDRFDMERLKSIVAVHRETWYAIGAIKNNDRYREYVESMPGNEEGGGITMKDALDYLLEEGEEKGTDRVNKLGTMLANLGRTDEFMKSLTDRDLQKKLFIELGLKEA